MVKVDWNIIDNYLLELMGIQDNVKEEFVYYGYDYLLLQYNGIKYLNVDYVLFDKFYVYIVKYMGNFIDNLLVLVILGQQKIMYVLDLVGYVDGKNWVIILLMIVLGNIIGYINLQGIVMVVDFGIDKIQGICFDLIYVMGKYELCVGYDCFKVDFYLVSYNFGLNNVCWIYGVIDLNMVIDDGVGIGVFVIVGGYGIQGYYVDQYFVVSGSGVSMVQKVYYIEDCFQVIDCLLLLLGFCNDSFINYNGDYKVYVEQKNNWVFCIGVVWDVNGNVMLKVFGNVGCYFLVILNNVVICGVSFMLNVDKYYMYIGIVVDGML